MVSKWFSTADTGGGPGSLRKVHRALALREMALHPGISRVELAACLGLSSMAVGRIVRELEDAGLSGDIETPPPNVGRGRPATGMHLLHDGAYVAGAVISAFSQEVHVLNLRGESIGSRTVPIADVSNAPKAVATFCAAINQLISDLGITQSRVAGCGFAVAANVDTELGAVVGGGYLGWPAFEMSGMAQSALGMPVTIGNIADALLRAEAFSGCAREASETVLIHAATTLGASYYANNQLMTGARFQAGRIGHFPVRPTRLVCSCGANDCLNCFASGWSVLAGLKKIDTPAYRTDQVQQYSQLTQDLVNGDHPAGQARKINRALAESGGLLAHGLRLLDLTFDPDLLVIAGPLAAHDAYFDGLNKSLQASGAHGADIAARLSRGQITPGHAAGINALLDTVFSPSLDLQRLANAAPGVVQPAPSTQRNKGQ